MLRRTRADFKFETPMSNDDMSESTIVARAFRHGVPCALGCTDWNIDFDAGQVTIGRLMFSDIGEDINAKIGKYVFDDYDNTLRIHVIDRDGIYNVGACICMHVHQCRSFMWSWRVCGSVRIEGAIVNSRTLARHDIDAARTYAIAVRPRPGSYCTPRQPRYTVNREIE